MSISLDGFVAGPDQSREDPLGKRGSEINGWRLGDERANEADATAERRFAAPPRRLRHGPQPVWPDPRRVGRGVVGLVGARAALPRARVRSNPSPSRADRDGGGGNVSLVTDGFDAAYAQARETAGADGIDIAGGASTVRQALLAGVIDELWLDIVPVLLGFGEGIFNGVAEFDFEPDEVLHSPLATHICYRRAG